MDQSDIVLYADPDEMLSDEDDGDIYELQPNEDEEDLLENHRRRAYQPPDRLNRDPALKRELESYLVKSAIVRSRTYKPKKKYPVLNSTDDVAQFLRHLAVYPEEHMVYLFMDSKRRLLAVAELGIGSFERTVTNMESMLRILFLTGSTKVIGCHNHPNSDPTPSRPDELVTDHMEHSLSCLGAELVDSMVIGNDGYTSILEGKTYDWSGRAMKKSRRGARR